VFPVLIKGNDELSQEVLAVQLIRRLNQIFAEEGTKLWLRPYNILLIDKFSGIIEFIPDTVSLSDIKQAFPSLLAFYQATWSNYFEEAQLRFTESLAGYSIACYLLNIKDRHNANIMFDNFGHVIHIDFGFMLGNSPGGNFGFEKAPFKLTEEMVEVIGGVEGELF
jgi:phosphatidylinositol 4-kinase